MSHILKIKKINNQPAKNLFVKLQGNTIQGCSKNQADHYRSIKKARANKKLVTLSAQEMIGKKLDLVCFDVKNNAEVPDNPKPYEITFYILLLWLGIQGFVLMTQEMNNWFVGGFFLLLCAYWIFAKPRKHQNLWDFFYIPIGAFHLGNIYITFKYLEILF